MEWGKGLPYGRRKCFMLKKKMYRWIYYFLISILISNYFVCFFLQTKSVTDLQKLYLFLCSILIFFLFLLYLDKRIFWNLRVKVLLFFFAAVIISFVFRNKLIPKIYIPSNITITILNEKDSESKGTEVWLKKILLDGKEQKLETYISDKEDTWILLDGVLFGDASLNSNPLDLQFPKAKSIQLNFGKHAWSGMITIISNRDEIGYNLYDPANSEIEIDIPIISYNYSRDFYILLFFGISWCLFYFLLIVYWIINFLFKEMVKERIENKGSENRYIGIDVIKTIAIFFVISVHFFMNTSFYTTELVGEVMFLQLTLRWLFHTCVPLFLLSTGFLQINKTYNVRYWKSGCDMLFSYVAISICCYFFRLLYLKEEISFFLALKRILNFSLDGYAWYIGMFIGLYLLIPSLNILYKNIGNRKEKLRLICIMCVLTSIPTSDFLWNYWIGIYPITFYLIGAYIREYQPKVNKLMGTILIVFLLFCEDIITLLVIRKNNIPTFTSVFIDGYGYIFSVGVSVMIFLIFYSVKGFEKSYFAEFIKEISSLTLEIYLISFMFDVYFYSNFKGKYFITQQEFSKYYFYIVPLVFLFSYISSYSFSFIKQSIVNRICCKERGKKK